MRFRMLFACALLAALFVANWVRVPEDARAAAPLPHRVIVRLAGESQQIDVLSTPHGPRYSVVRGGRFIADSVSLDRLRSIDPQSFHQITTGHAEPAGPIYAGSE